MRVQGLIQSSVTEELTAEADDAENARAVIEEQVPEGYELIRVRHAMPRGGRVIATGTIRLAEVQELEAEGADYVTTSPLATVSALRFPLDGDCSASSGSARATDD